MSPLVCAHQAANDDITDHHNKYYQYDNNNMYNNNLQALLPLYSNPVLWLLVGSDNTELSSASASGPAFGVFMFPFYQNFAPLQY